jgi:hypothetical protein
VFAKVFSLFIGLIDTDRYIVSKGMWYKGIDIKLLMREW